MTTPRIMLDGREFLPGRLTGIGRYLLTVLDHVVRHPPAWALELVVPPGFAPPRTLPTHVVGRRDAWGWDLWELPRFLRGSGACALVTPYVKFRPLRGIPVVLIMCDPSDLLPDLARRTASTTWAIRLLRAFLARRAAVRITISRWSRAELARILRLPQESFLVIPPGIDLPSFPPPEQIGTEILHLSNGKPHKNLGRLVEAYAALPAPLQRQHPLVLAGIHRECRDAIERTVALHAPSGQIRLGGFVEESDLPLLFSRAAVFAFPSLVEGFGIPPLEAMAHGVPVVASTGGALPETLGDAAVLIDPRDARSLSGALAAVLTDRALRARLIPAGHQRVRLFSAARTGAALAEAIGQAAHGDRTV